ncbi:MAG: Kazal-type serine protease inhibitor family protein, partial [Phycisphaerae bacterium]
VICIETTADACFAEGGEYQGDGTTCSTDPTVPPCPPPAGGCCLPDGNCVELPPDHCIAMGGEPLPPGVPCDPNVCAGPASGACCLPDAAGTVICIETTADACFAEGGEYLGDGTVCPADPTQPCAPPVGGCCFPNGNCQEVPEEMCLAAGGDFLGAGTGCPTDPNVPCGPPPTGACCIHDAAGNTIVCVEATAHDCWMEGGVYVGDGSTCPANPADLCGPPVGACCFPDGTCADLPLDVCLIEGGNPLPGASCDLVDCGPPPTGACCVHDPMGIAACIETTPSHCHLEGGMYMGDGTTCPPDPNELCGPPAGACCFPGGECLELPLDVCMMEGGEPLPGATCDTVDCPGSPIGACCLNDSTGAVYCFECTLEECHAAGGAFQGPGSTCPIDPSEPCGSPCDHLCPPGQFCFAGCGTLIQGVECVLFAADSGGVFILGNLGGFHVGDRVFVAGCHEPNCTSFCMQGDGCITGNVIEPCGQQQCGGIAGIPCDDPNMVCNFPIGTCGMNDVFGVCTPHSGVCPDVWDPVCGCDGVTYGNDCEAAAAAVSIAHLGECGIVCEPTSDGMGCAPLACSPIPEEQCLITVVGHDPVTGSHAAVACECRDFNLCHIEFMGGMPTAVGGCPDGGVCELVELDLDGDGVVDVVTAECVPTGACCSDIGGSPLPVPECTQARPDVCVASGGVFAGPGTTCDVTQACCLPLQGADACVDINPFCCEVFHGVPQGPDTTCLDVNGQNTCPQICGGFAGIPCDPGEFCKFPDGTCHMADIFGLCVVIPDACPEIYAPVCGCDGITYVNECEADAAGVSIDHPGQCVGGDCAATRILADPTDPSYCAGVTRTVRIVLAPPAAATAIGVEDAPPAGWVVSNISNGGTFDAVNWKVKWGPLFPPFPAELTYDVTPAADASGTACFAGTISVDGINQAICGNDCLDACCPHIPADVPQSDCAACPVGDCTSCPDGACADGHVSMCELVGYACAWMTGCNDDLAGMTRTAYVWRSGECYCWDDGQGNWFPSSCTDNASSVCCPGGPPGSSGAGISPGVTLGSAIAEVRPLRTGRDIASGDVRVPITIEAPAGTKAVGVECLVPAGWEITAITDGGVWDASHRKVKWGPFLDNLSRTVSFKAHRTFETATAKTRRLRDRGGLSGFTGTVSFDGVNQAITIN